MGITLSKLVIGIVATSAMLLVLIPMVLELEANYGVTNENLTAGTSIASVLNNLTKTASTANTAAINSTGGIGLDGSSVNPNSGSNMNLLSYISAIQYVSLIYTVPKIIFTETLLFLGVPPILIGALAVCIVIAITLFLLSSFFYRPL